MLFTQTLALPFKLQYSLGRPTYTKQTKLLCWFPQPLSCRFQSEKICWQLSCSPYLSRAFSAQVPVQFFPLINMILFLFFLSFQIVPPFYLIILQKCNIARFKNRPNANVKWTVGDDCYPTEMQKGFKDCTQVKLSHRHVIKRVH